VADLREQEQEEKADGRQGEIKEQIRAPSDSGQSSQSIGKLGLYDKCTTGEEQQDHEETV